MHVIGVVGFSCAFVGFLQLVVRTLAGVITFLDSSV